MPVATDTAPWITTAELADQVPTTYQTLNRLATKMGWTPGSGNHRYWPPDSAQRLRVAFALARALAVPGESPKLRPAAVAVLAGPPPGTGGYVAYDPDSGSVRYGATPGGALGPMNAAVIVHLPGAKP
jgi:hypothetical protein